MQIPAIYNTKQGKLTFLTTVHLKSDQVRVRVELPDEEVEALATEKKGVTRKRNGNVDRALEEIDIILGPDYQYIDDGKTDKQRFAEGLMRSGKYTT